MTEGMALELARAGRPDAYGFLYEQNYGRVLRLARRYVRSPEDAEDVAQNAFIKAFDAMGTYDPGRGSGFQAWINRICVHCAIDFLRYKKRRTGIGQVSLDALPQEPASATPSPRADRHRPPHVLPSPRCGRPSLSPPADHFHHALPRPSQHPSDRPALGLQRRQHPRPSVPFDPQTQGLLPSSRIRFSDIDRVRSEPSQGTSLRGGTCARLRFKLASGYGKARPPGKARGTRQRFNRARGYCGNGSPAKLVGPLPLPRPP